MKIINVNEDVSSYFFKDESLRKKFDFFMADKFGEFESNNQKIRMGYFVKYNAIATYEGEKLNNIIFYMSNWETEKVQAIFKAGLKNKNFNLYHCKGVRVVKIY